MRNKIKIYSEAMRLNQPIGIFLLLWPCLISLNMANSGYFNLKYTIIFIIGSILMRSAGCIINDIIDADIDCKVFRTKERPITTGKLQIKEATNLVVILLLASASLLFFFNKPAILISLFSILLIIIYPFCKRFTYFPQLFLGITYNIGVLIAWLSIHEKLSLPAFLLYIGCIFWTLGYDTIYALQDVKDDIKIGVKSTAIYFGEKTEKFLNIFYTITATMFFFSGNMINIGKYYNIWIIIPISILFWQVKTIVIDDIDNCRRRFKLNFFVGLFMYFATLATRYIL